MSSRRRWSFAIACAVFAAGAGIAATADAGDVTLTLRDGRATIVARSVSLQQVLREWALRGGTRFVNLERVANTPITIELKDMPERQALAILLRSVAGYIAAPRAVANRSASLYDRILILPTSMASPNPAMPPRAVTLPSPVIPDPTELANDEADVAASPGGEPGPPGPQNPPVFVPPSDGAAPTPADDSAQEQQAEPANPGVLPSPGITPGSTPGQFTSPAPGVLPPPPPVQQPRQ
jgi:hypothetical protein